MAWSASFCLIVLIVRAYASSGNGVSTGLSMTLPPECVGQDICLTRPNDYPMEEIDQLARRLAKTAGRICMKYMISTRTEPRAKQKRWKRHSTQHLPQIVPAEKLADANNCATSYTTVQPFIVTYNNTPHYVVQSRFLTQTFQIASCKMENARCFQDFLLPQVETKCRTKYFTFFFTTYDPNNSRAKQIGSLLPVDCACELNLMTSD